MPLFPVTLSSNGGQSTSAGVVMRASAFHVIVIKRRFAHRSPIARADSENAIRSRRLISRGKLFSRLAGGFAVACIHRGRVRREVRALCWVLSRRKHRTMECFSVTSRRRWMNFQFIPPLGPEGSIVTTKGAGARARRLISTCLSRVLDGRISKADSRRLTGIIRHARSVPERTRLCRALTFICI